MTDRFLRPHRLLWLLLLQTHVVDLSNAATYRFGMVSGNSEFFHPIEEGWNDECERLQDEYPDDEVICEHYYTGHSDIAANNLTYDKENDVKTCVTFIRWFIERGDIDGIATKCNVDEEGPPIVQEAYDAGIPVVVFAGPHVGPYAAYIGTNNIEVGRAMARQLKQLRPEGGDYVTTYNGPSSYERAVGFVEEIEKDNNRDDKAHWVEAPVNYTALGWDQSEWKGVTKFGFSSIPPFMDIIAEANPTAIAFMYQSPMRHENYTDIIDKHRHRNISYIGTEGNANDLVLMARNYVDGLIGQQTYETGVFAARALFRIVTEGVENVPNRFGTKLINYNLVPDELPTLKVDQSLLGNLKYTGFTCFGVVAFFVVIFIAWTIWNRKGIVVKASQPFFLVMTGVGILILAATMIPLSFDDGGVKISETRAVGICMSIPWLAFTGFGITFSALFAKTWRVNKFFKSTRTYGRIKVSEQDVLYPFFVIFTLNTAILMCWTIIDPLTYARQFADGTDLWNREIASNGSCRSDNAGAYLIPLGLINFIVLAIACWQAFEARDIKCEFAEAKYIALAVFSMSQGFLTGIPIVAVAKDIPEAFYLILTFLLFVICMVVLLLIFVPKIFTQRHYNTLSIQDQRKLMSVSVRLSSGQAGSRISGIGTSSAFRTSGGNRFEQANTSDNNSKNYKIITMNGNIQDPVTLSRVNEVEAPSTSANKTSADPKNSSKHSDSSNPSGTDSTRTRSKHSDGGDVEQAKMEQAKTSDDIGEDMPSGTLVEKESGRYLRSSYIDDEEEIDA